MNACKRHFTQKEFIHRHKAELQSILKEMRENGNYRINIGTTKGKFSLVRDEDMHVSGFHEYQNELE